MTSSQLQDEPIRTFLDARIPKWEELSSNELLVHVEALRDTESFMFYWVNQDGEGLAPIMYPNPATGLWEPVNAVRYQGNVGQFSTEEAAAISLASPIEEILLAGAATAAYDEKEYPEPQEIEHGELSPLYQQISEMAPGIVAESGLLESGYPIRVGEHAETTLEIQQSEPLTDFLNRYIPDWPDLDAHELGREVLFLLDQFDFEVSYENNGNTSISWVDYSFGGPPTFEPSPAIELPDHRWLWPSKTTSIYNTVRYYPAGTAAFQDTSIHSQPGVHLASGEHIITSPEEAERLAAEVSFATPAGEVTFGKMAHNEAAFDILIDTAHAWQHQANYIRETTDDIRIAQRAQFAANTAFQAAKALQENKASVVAAYLPDHMVGLSVYQIYPDKTALLNLVTVAPYLQPGNPDANIRGIGTGMVCKVSEDLIAQQVTQVCLKPLDDQAETFWRRRGFEPQGRDKLCVIDGVEKLLLACTTQPDCPDQGDHCTVGNERQMARFTQPSIAGQLYARR